MAFSIDVQNATLNLNLIEKCRQLQENVFLYIAGLAIHPTGVKPLQASSLREIYTAHFHFILPTLCFQLRLPPQA
jgi:hypothetical protein